MEGHYCRFWWQSPEGTLKKNEVGKTMGNFLSVFGNKISEGDALLRSLKFGLNWNAKWLAFIRGKSLWLSSTIGAGNNHRERVLSQKGRQV